MATVARANQGLSIIAEHGKNISCKSEKTDGKIAEVANEVEASEIFTPYYNSYV